MNKTSKKSEALASIALKSLAAAVIMATQSSQVYAFTEELTTEESILADPVIATIVNDPLDLMKDESREDASTAAEVSGTFIGGGYVSTDKLDIFTLPISKPIKGKILGGKEQLSLNASFSHIENDTNNKSGIGDSSFGVDYSHTSDSGLTIQPSFTIKVPTGDEDDGLGTGSTDSALSLGIKQSFGGSNVNGKFSYVSKSSGNIGGSQFDYGNILVADVGGRFQAMDNLWLSTNVVYIRQEGNELTNFTPTTFDGLETWDIIPMITFRVNDMFNINARYVFAAEEDPIREDTPLATPDREDSFTISVTSGF